jgi:hypothetical protein
VHDNEEENEENALETSMTSLMLNGDELMDNFISESPKLQIAWVFLKSHAILLVFVLICLSIIFALMLCLLKLYRFILKCVSLVSQMRPFVWFTEQ